MAFKVIIQTLFINLLSYHAHDKYIECVLKLCSNQNITVKIKSLYKVCQTNPVNLGQVQ